jgi:hypothetical protein
MIPFFGFIISRGPGGLMRGLAIAGATGKEHKRKRGGEEEKFHE